MRFRDAMEAGDHAAVVASLSPDLVLISPIFEAPLSGSMTTADSTGPKILGLRSARRKQ